ncbi:DUF2061 domain-containing protein [Endothiovibrio diazotrophicus]
MAKTVSFAAVHFTVAFSVGYLMTGSVAIGGAMALVEPAVNTVAYFFHEKVWAHFTAHSGAHGAREPAEALPAAP